MAARIDPALYWRFKAMSQAVQLAEAAAAQALARHKAEIEAAMTRRRAVLVEIAAAHPELNPDAASWEFNDHDCSLTNGSRT